MSKVDLNLFVIFDCIMKEQSISGAAQSLHMTQPSVSNAVSRMRHQWNDMLFVKNGRGIKPTPFANQLWLQIADPLSKISSAINPTQFVPSLARQTFRISLTDGMTAMLWLPIRNMLEAKAPGIDIHAVPFKGNGEQLLLNNEVDLVLDAYQGDHRLVHTRWMSNLSFALVMRVNHQLANSAVNLQDFVKAQHLLVSLSGDAQGIVDRKLAELNLKRRIAMTVNSFRGVVDLITQSNLVTVLPKPVVLSMFDHKEVVCKDLPFEIPNVKIHMSWHTRQNRDPALKWLIGEIEQVYNTVVLNT